MGILVEVNNVSIHIFDIPWYHIMFAKFSPICTVL